MHGVTLSPYTMEVPPMSIINTQNVPGYFKKASGKSLETVHHWYGAGGETTVPGT